MIFRREYELSRRGQHCCQEQAERKKYRRDDVETLCCELFRYISFATALTVQGLILNKRGRPSEAEAILREAVKLRMENLPESHFMTALTKGALGEVLLDEKKLDEAAPPIRSSYASLAASQKTENERLRSGKARLDRLESAISQNSTSH